MSEAIEIQNSSITSTDMDYSYVPNSARIAVYDDLLSSPKIVDVNPDTTTSFLSALASKVYELAKSLGGSIPFSIILQVVENFIHARFTEMVISIFDSGNTIRFSDQGPGIPDKEKAQRPGYSSATKEMKEYINGVGSGLPIVKEYLEIKNGTIELEDNMQSGAVVTISLNPNHENLEYQRVNPDIKNINSFQSPIENTNAFIQDQSLQPSNRDQLEISFLIKSMSSRSLSIVKLFEIESIWGVKDISESTGIPLSSTHGELKKLEDMGIVGKIGKKWVLTDIGNSVIKAL